MPTLEGVAEDATIQRLWRLIGYVERYEAAWRAGHAPSLEEYLLSAPEDERADLLRELTALEAELKENHGAAASSAKYGCRSADSAFEADEAIASDPPEAASHRRHERFNILRSHDFGGLGEVYVAEDLDIRREVAVKQLRPPYAHDADARSRFMREAVITGRLEHPGIVPIYGVGRYADGRPFYAMRLIEGENLLSAIATHHANMRDPSGTGRTQPRSLRQLLGRFVTVCETIAYAHSRGVLHRDIKPANVMLGPYGETLVVDWGLAKLLWEEPARTDSCGVQSSLPTWEPGGNLTAARMVLGTPAYMSPEQACGQHQSIGTRSDIYGLGATLYHLLTGVPPYTRQGRHESEPDEALLKRVQSGDIAAPRTLDSRIPKALQSICLKAMSKASENRYETALELADEVRRWLDGEPVRAFREPFARRTGRWLKRHRMLVMGFAVAVSMSTLTAGGAWYWVAGENARRSELVRKRLLRSWDEARLSYSRALASSAEDLTRWPKALDDSNNLKDLIEANPVDSEMRKQFQNLYINVVLDNQSAIRRAEEARTERMSLQRLVDNHIDKGTGFDVGGMDDVIRNCFLEYDVDIQNAESSRVAAALKKLRYPIQDILIAALDDWAIAIRSRSESDPSWRRITTITIALSSYSLGSSIRSASLDQRPRRRKAELIRIAEIITPELRLEPGVPNPWQIADRAYTKQNILGKNHAYNLSKIATANSQNILGLLLCIQREAEKVEHDRCVMLQTFMRMSRPRVRLNSTLVPSILLLAQLLAEAGEHDRSLDLLRALQEAIPNDSRVRYELTIQQRRVNPPSPSEESRILSEDRMLRAEAAKQLERALSFNPTIDRARKVSHDNGIALDEIGKRE